MKWSAWTAERIALLADGWRAGLPVWKIAEAVGLSRNACIGKAARTGLGPHVNQTFNGTESKKMRSQRKSNGSDAASDKPQDMVVPLVPKPFYIDPNTDPEIVAHGVSFLEAGPHHCRAIKSTGDGPNKLVRFCGCPTVDDTSWCAGHKSIYFGYTPGGR